jgi:hypothetical protein
LILSFPSSRYSILSPIIFNPSYENQKSTTICIMITIKTPEMFSLQQIKYNQSNFVEFADDILSF